MTPEERVKRRIKISREANLRVRILDTVKYFGPVTPEFVYKFYTANTDWDTSWSEFLHAMHCMMSTGQIKFVSLTHIIAGNPELDKEDNV